MVLVFCLVDSLSIDRPFVSLRSFTSILPAQFPGRLFRLVGGLREERAHPETRRAGQTVSRLSTHCIVVQWVGAEFY